MGSSASEDRWVADLGRWLKGKPDGSHEALAYLTLWALASVGWPVRDEVCAASSTTAWFPTSQSRADGACGPVRAESFQWSSEQKRSRRARVEKRCSYAMETMNTVLLREIGAFLVALFFGTETKLQRGIASNIVGGHKSNHVVLEWATVML